MRVRPWIRVGIAGWVAGGMLATAACLAGPSSLEARPIPSFESSDGGVPMPAAPQAKSGPQSIDACGVLTRAELEAAVKRKVRPSAVPASQPTSIGVSVCMYATTDGLHTASVTTYGPEAIRRTQSKTLQAYYDAMKTSNAQLAGKPPVVIPGAGRHASFFANPRNAGDVLLVLRDDCVVVTNLNGFTREEAIATGKAIGQ